ncbi:hypothetical protein B0H19DRAFT_944929, partial [Mycena capillaripes]
FTLLLSVASTRAVLNGPCTGGGLATGVGVCITTANCHAGGGTSTPGLCPGTPTNVQCCTKTPCGVGAFVGGTCRFTSSCTGNNHRSLIGLCPGPKDYQCCVPCAPDRRDGSSGELDKRLPGC